MKLFPTNRRNQRGNVMVEFALSAPIALMFMTAAFDFGFYAYAFISVENAARSAALRNSGGRESAADQPAACAVAMQELRGLPNIGTLATCGTAPLIVTSVLCDGPGACAGSAGTPDGAPAAAVTISYTMPSVFRIAFTGPGVITRTSEMKVRTLQ
ncbi:MAG: TadE family protein [Bryobacteraceae bacterium]